MDSTAGWRAVTERSAHLGSVTTMYKTQMFKKNLRFHYSLGIKASEAGITATPAKDLPMESPAS